VVVVRVVLIELLTTTAETSFHKDNIMTSVLYNHLLHNSHSIFQDLNI
jgi:hypothetical protein